MWVQKLDAFAVKSYAFTLGNTNTYFTVATIALSLLIVAAAVIVNFHTVSHLWLPRAQLPSEVSLSYSYPDPLTSTLLCYRDNNPSASTPVARIISSPHLKTIDFPFFDEDTIRSTRPDVSAKLQSGFGCFDIGGFAFSQANKEFYVEVQAPNASLFIESTTPEAVISKNETTFIECRQGKQRLVRILHAVDSDTLVLNAPPSMTNTILTEPDSLPVFEAPIMFPFTSSHAKFLVSYYIPVAVLGINYVNFSLQSVKISRYDIGYIIGAVLSWVSLMTMACALAIAPIMEKKQLLEMAESLFELQPHQKRPNVLKFIAAELSSGIFPKEDLYVSLCQQTDKMKDVAIMMKGIRISKRLCSATQERAEEMACEENFDPRKEEIVNFYPNHEEELNTPNLMEPDHKKQGKTVVYRKKLLKALDIGSDTVSILYAREGHGSKLSICLSLLFIAGFIAFLLMFNIVQLSTTVTVRDQLTSGTLTYTPSPSEIIFASSENAEVLVSLLDGRYNIISNLTLISSPSCLNTLTSAQISQLLKYGEYYYCLNETITFASPPSHNETVSLYVNNINFRNQMLGVFHLSPPSASPHYRPINAYIQIFPIYDQSYTFVYKQSKLALTSIVSSSGDEEIFAQFTPLTQVNNRLTNGITGISIILKPTVTIVSEEDSTMFDIVENVWGLAVVCFTVFLYKITKYINSHQKQTKMNPQRANFRENICILLAKLNGLGTGRHGRQLKHAKFYLKQPLYHKL